MRRISVALNHLYLNDFDVPPDGAAIFEGGGNSSMQPNRSDEDSVPASTSGVLSVIESLMASLTERMRDLFSGNEAYGLVEITRAADYVTVFSKIIPDDLIDAEMHRDQFFKKHGIGPALNVLLPMIKHYDEGMPWAPTDEHRTLLTDSLLYQMGQLAYLRRVARMERYGLCKSEKVDAKTYRLIQCTDTAEVIDIIKGNWLTRHRQRRLGELRRRITSRKQWAAKRLGRFCSPDKGWFLRYDFDPGLGRHFQDIANLKILESQEGEAFPDEVMLGPLSFGEWRRAATHWYGRMLYHQAFAIHLGKTNKNLNIRDLLTLYWRRDELISDFWYESFNLNEEQATKFIDAATLNADSIDGWLDSDDVPTPLYIDFGKHFLLLPMFGVHLNPFAAILKHLRATYTSDWDASVDLREAEFRRELAELFPAPRFVVSDTGIKLKNSSGGKISDIDAVIFDRKTGSIALLQIKWQDLFAFSLRERISRYKNLKKADEWVARISNWIDGRSSIDVARAFGLKIGGVPKEPRLFVMARYAVRFTGVEPFDQRATWVTWADLMHARKTMIDDDFIEAFWTKMREVPDVDSHRPHGRYEIGGYIFEVKTEDIFKVKTGDDGDHRIISDQC